VSTYEIPTSTDDIDVPLGAVPIGRPIDGVRFRILDADLGTVADGDIGELCVSGPTLACGYLNEPGLRDRHFISNPFEEDGSSLYRTGDICRCRVGEIVEYVGRVDDQLKIRGFRIEPREIEHLLQTHEAIRETVVRAIEVNGDRRLVAYFVAARNGKGVVAAELREFLASRLPGHMVPAHFIQLEAIPRTPNNKVDRKALAVPSLGDLCSGDDDAMDTERLPSEESLAEIWAEVLGVSRVGIHQAFTN